jgi:hypothetical protein
MPMHLFAGLCQKVRIATIGENDDRVKMDLAKLCLSFLAVCWTYGREPPMSILRTCTYPNILYNAVIQETYLGRKRMHVIDRTGWHS